MSAVISEFLNWTKKDNTNGDNFNRNCKKPTQRGDRHDKMDKEKICKKQSPTIHKKSEGKSTQTTATKPITDKNINMKSASIEDLLAATKYPNHKEKFDSEICSETPKNKTDEKLPKYEVNKKRMSSIHKIFAAKNQMAALKYCGDAPLKTHPFHSYEKQNDTESDSSSTITVKLPEKDEISMNINTNCNKSKPKCVEPLDYRPEKGRCMKGTRGKKYFYNGFANQNDRSNPEYQVHAAEFLKFLASLWITRSLCDLVFRIENRKYSAHRIALAMFSKKYRDQFQSSQKCDENSNTTEIRLTNTTDAALEAILKYIYTSEIDINPANADEIQNGARELGIENLVCMSRDYLDSLTIGDVLTYMKHVFDRDGTDLIAYELYVYMMTHLAKVSRTPEYFRASLCAVKTLLSDSNLCVCSEVEVFDAAMRWINYDRPRRECHLYEILKSVRFSLMTPEELHTKVESYSFLRSNKDINSMITMAYKYHSFKNYENPMMSNLVRREEPRGSTLKGSGVPDKFVRAVLELAEKAEELKLERNQLASNVIKFKDNPCEADSEIDCCKVNTCDSAVKYMVPVNKCRCCEAKRGKKFSRTASEQMFDALKTPVTEHYKPFASSSTIVNENVTVVNNENPKFNKLNNYINFMEASEYDMRCMNKCANNKGNANRDKYRYQAENDMDERMPCKLNNNNNNSPKCAQNAGGDGLVKCSEV